MSSIRTARYFDVLALPQIPRTFGIVIVGRAAYALVLLPLLYAVSEATQSIALAGVSVAVYGATASFLAPVRAWFVDRYGARLVLAILTIVFGTAIAALAWSSLAGGPGVLLIAIAGVAGAFAPPIGPTMRVAWGKLAPTDELLKKGLSLDAVVEELLYLAGPALGGLALTVIAPGAALFIPAALVTIGGLLFVATPAVGAMKPHGRAVVSAAPRRSLLGQSRFAGLLLPVVVAGAVSGTVSVAVPVMLAEHGGPAAAGLALGVFAGGSALGGLLYGTLKLRGSLATQLVVSATALLVISSLVAVASGFLAVSVVLGAAGLFFSPVMIVAYVAAHAAGGEHQQNAATTWVNTGHNVGGAAGSALVGVLIQASGPSTAILGIGIVAAGLLALSVVLSRRGTRSTG